MKQKEIIVNVKTGKKKIVEKDIEQSTIAPVREESLNIKDAVKLVKYAKLHGWI